MNKLNDTMEMLNNQASMIRGHIQKLFEKLPESLEDSAKNLGALVRKRGVQDAVSLLLALLVYVCAEIS